MTTRHRVSGSKYRVFTRSRQGDLDYRDSSSTLGMGALELSRIVDAHRLKVGDVIYYKNKWLLLTKKEGSGRTDYSYHIEYEYLPAWEDTDLTFGDETWGTGLINRLNRQADRIEGQRADAIKSRRWALT